MFLDDRRLVGDVNNKEYQSEDRPLWHAAGDVDGDRALAIAQGRSQDFTLGATEAERRRRENRGVKGAERSGDWGGGVPPQPTRGSGGAS